MTWGFFEGGFNLGVTNANGTTGCKRSTTSAVTNTKKADYIPHHQPFQYYTSTANPTHARPKSVASDRLQRRRRESSVRYTGFLRCRQRRKLSRRFPS